MSPGPRPKWSRLHSGHYSSTVGDVKRVEGLWYFYAPDGFEHGPFRTCARAKLQPELLAETP